MIDALKSHEPVKLFGETQLAEYIPTQRHGSTLVHGWALRLEVGDIVIEGWGETQEEARFMFDETVKQWLHDTNQRPVIA